LTNLEINELEHIQVDAGVFSFRQDWPTWIGELVVVWMFACPLVFLVLTAAAFPPVRLCSRVISRARRIPDRSDVRETWRNIRRDAVTVIGRPLTLVIAFLLMATPPLMSDAVKLLGQRLQGQGRADLMQWAMSVESGGLVLMLVLTIVPWTAVLLETRDRAKRDPTVQRWCARCGYSLDGSPAASQGVARCPECGEHTIADRLRPARKVPRSPRVAAAILLVGLGLILAENHWRPRIGSGLPGLVRPAVKDEVAIIPVGGAVRAERPGETIWIRVDRSSFSLSNLLGKETAPDDEAPTVRAITETHGDGAENQSGAAPRPWRGLAIINARPHSANPRTRTHTTSISCRGDRDIMLALPDWYPKSDVVWVGLVPCDATSIQAVDPATVPPFK
jgi:hypothetical protein